MLDIENEKRILKERLLGWSAMGELIEPGVTNGMDLKLETSSTGIDLAKVTSMDTLTQALRIALTTRLGDDIFNTSFGFDGLNALTENDNHVMIRERIRIAVILVLNKEPRIKRILDVKLSDGQLELAPNGTFVEGSDVSDSTKMEQRRELNVALAFETIDGERAILNMGALGAYG